MEAQLYDYDEQEEQENLDDIGAEIEAGALPLKTLEGWLRDIRYQPAWRTAANIESDFYDGNQLDSATLTEMKNRGVAPLITNLIAPTIDVVLGMEAKSRTDWKVAPDDDEDQELADALNVKLHEAERLSWSDRAISDTYASQIKVGLGWVEVARETDPFKSKYRVKHIHRRELWWDWLAKEPDLSDARYLVRKRWLDEDIACAHFPQFRDLIHNSVNGWSDFSLDMMEPTAEPMARWLASEYGVEQTTSLEEMEWLDLERRRVCMYEVWYRKYENGYIMRLPDGYVLEYDGTNPQHNALIAAGIITPIPAVLTKVRLAWWLGPHRLVDMESPYPHNHFPYVPFFGKREDQTGVPYGLIRAMRSPQEAVNARSSKMMWNLASKRVIVDEDAVDDVDLLAAEVARPDCLIELKANRSNRTKDALRIEDEQDLTAQQFQLYLDDKKTLQDVAGVYQQMLGQDLEGGAKSGVAINSLVEQGTTTLAEINDNYRYSRMRVGELLLSLVKEDIGDLPTEVVVDRGTSKQRKVMLNGLEVNPEGRRTRTNNVQRTAMSVVLEDVPNTPTYRAQQQTMLTELTKSLPPEVQMAILDIVIEVSDTPRKDEIAEKIRSITGQFKNPDDMTPEEYQQYQMQMQEQARQQQYMIDMQNAELAKLRAEATKTGAQADVEREKVNKTAAETDKLEMEVDATPMKQDLEMADQVMRMKRDEEQSKFDQKLALQQAKQKPGGKAK